MVSGSLSALSGPSWAALTRQTVPDDLLPSAVALQRLLQDSAMIVGFAGAGIMVALAGSGWAIAVDVATFAVAAYCFHRLDVPRLPAGPVGSVDRQPRTMVGDLGEGSARSAAPHLAMDPHPPGHAVPPVLRLYGGVQGVLGPIAVCDAWNDAAWGWALAALMTGYMVGGLVSLRFRPHRGLLVGTLLLALTACISAAIALGDSLTVLLLGAFLHRFGLEVFSVNGDLSIQPAMTRMRHEMPTPRGPSSVCRSFEKSIRRRRPALLVSVQRQSPRAAFWLAPSGIQELACIRSLPSVRAVSPRPLATSSPLTVSTST
jgi:hypothetical protein